MSSCGRKAGVMATGTAEEAIVPPRAGEDGAGEGARCEDGGGKIKGEAHIFDV